MKTITSLLLFLLLLCICPFTIEGEVPKVEQAPDTECADCINHDILAKYVDLYACEGDWKCKWESSALTYINCLDSKKSACNKKAIDKLTSVLGYIGPAEKKGKKYYRLAFDKISKNYKCNSLTQEFYHDAAVTFGYICDDEYFEKSVRIIQEGCPGNNESAKMLEAIKLGHDYSTIKYGSVEFHEFLTKKWNQKIKDCNKFQKYMKILKINEPNLSK